MQKSLFILSFLLTAVVSSCGDDYQSSIPDMRVDFSCSLLQNPYYKIQTLGQFLAVEKDNHGIPVGYAGLIIGQSIFGGYYAYDAACPVEVSQSVAVEVQEDGLGTAICPKCGTTYNLSNSGYPQGEGTEYLKRYKVSVSGSTLHVSN